MRIIKNNSPAEYYPPSEIQAASRPRDSFGVLRVYSPEQGNSFPLNIVISMAILTGMKIYDVMVNNSTSPFLQLQSRGFPATGVSFLTHPQRPLFDGRPRRPSHNRLYP